jgi:hypothetical protein
MNELGLPVSLIEKILRGTPLKPPTVTIEAMR